MNKEWLDRNCEPKAMINSSSEEYLYEYGGYYFTLTHEKGVTYLDVMDGYSTRIESEYDLSKKLRAMLILGLSSNSNYQAV